MILFLYKKKHKIRENFENVHKFPFVKIKINRYNRDFKLLPLVVCSDTNNTVESKNDKIKSLQNKRLTKALFENQKFVSNKKNENKVVFFRED